MNEIDKKLIDYMDNLHAFNLLNERHIILLSVAFNVDCKKLCKENGIVYDLREHDKANEKQIF